MLNNSHDIKEKSKKKTLLKCFYDKQKRTKIKKLTEMFGKISLCAFLCALVCGITEAFANNESLKSISLSLCYFCICAFLFFLIIFFILASILDSTDRETKKRSEDMAANNDFIEEGYFGKFK